MTKDENSEAWKTAAFQLDPDDDLAPLSVGARGLEAHAQALEGVGIAVNESRVHCHCIGTLGQRCFACDPDGTMYGLIRPDLAVRIIG